MNEINTKLGLTLLIIVVISTLVTTFAFYNLEDSVAENTVMISEPATGQVSINIEGPENLPEPIEATGQVSIELK